MRTRPRHCGRAAITVAPCPDSTPTRCAPASPTRGSTSAPTPAATAATSRSSPTPRSPAASTSSSSATRAPTGRSRRATSWPRSRCSRDACARHGALLAVNDRADVALASGADVLHLGQDDLPVAVGAQGRRRRGGRRPLGAQRRRDRGGRGRAGRRLLLRGPLLADARPSRAARHRGWTWSARWRGARRRGRGSRSAGSTAGGSTRCWRPVPSGWSSSGRSPRRTTRAPRPLRWPRGCAPDAAATGSPDGCSVRAPAPVTATLLAGRPAARSGCPRRSAAVVRAAPAGVGVGVTRECATTSSSSSAPKPRAGHGRAARPRRSPPSWSPRSSARRTRSPTSSRSSVDVSVLAPFEPPSTEPSDVPPGRCDVEAARVQRRALDQLDAR